MVRATSSHQLGVPWDKDSLPDITIGIANQNDTIIYMLDTVITNVSKNRLPIEINIPNVVLPTVQQNYSIILFDVDSASKEKIGEKVIFKPYELVNDYLDGKTDDLQKATNVQKNNYMYAHYQAGIFYNVLVSYLSGHEKEPETYTGTDVPWHRTM